jgi:hypothetical protein
LEYAVDVGAVPCEEQGRKWHCGEDRDIRRGFGLSEVGCGSGQLDGRVDADESLDARERLDGIHTQYFSHGERHLVEDYEVIAGDRSDDACMVMRGIRVVGVGPDLTSDEGSKMK